MANNIPEWLTLQDFPQTGIGDLGHLKFFLGVGERGKWLGFINSGWYYYSGLELYHYIVEGQLTYAAPAGSGEVVEPISFRPAWGPIIVYGNGNVMYEPIFPVFEPCQTLNWSPVSGTDLYVADYPSNATLV